jgi:hypothetical protein
MIKCAYCGIEKERNPDLMYDNFSEGWKSILSQIEPKFITLCPKCRKIVEEHANEILKIVKSDLIYLYDLISEDNKK